MKFSRSALHPPRRRLIVRLPQVGGWLPGAITLANLFVGFLAILFASQGRFLAAASLIIAAGILDGLDGRVARLTGTTSEFGEQLDSLADAVSFAVAPAMLAFYMGINALGRVGWAVTYFFVACGVLRLARFNLSALDRRFFLGLPIPVAAAALACPALVNEGLPLPQEAVPLYAAGVVVVAMLMVSRIRYRSFKELHFGPRPYRVLALWAILLAGLLAATEYMIPALTFLYIASPVASRLLVRFGGKRSPVAESGADDTFPPAAGERSGS